MIEIIPNWHPILVHFTVALLSISVALHLVVLVAGKASWRGAALTVARWNLGLGIAFAALTLASGFYAYFTVAHDDPAHLAMKDHRNWALATLTVFTLLGLWHWMRHRGNSAVKRRFAALMVVGGLLLAVTAWKGGGLVYEHGLGVQSLPEVSGEGHDHGDGGHDDDAGAEDHDDAAAEEEGHGHDEGEGHDDADAAAGDVVSEAAVSGDGHDHVHAADLATGGPAGALNAFRKALGSGDKDAVIAALAADVAIYESGFIEASRDAYASHHMGADMAYIGAIKTTVTSQKVHTMGDMAMVLTESRMTGTYREQAVDRISLETAILHKTADGWKVIHLHWGGRPTGE